MYVSGKAVGVRQQWWLQLIHTSHAFRRNERRGITNNASGLPQEANDTASQSIQRALRERIPDPTRRFWSKVYVRMYPHVGRFNLLVITAGTWTQWANMKKHAW
jgi:FAD/FMN-containing dehydrogenase